MRLSFLVCAAGLTGLLASCGSPDTSATGGGGTTSTTTDTGGTGGTSTGATGGTSTGATGGTGGTGGATCGNGVTDAGEDCDFGAAFNGPDTGCETDCTFSCGQSPDTCPDGDACNGVEVCMTVLVDSKPGQKCVEGEPAPECTACNGGICKNSACTLSTCGDGCVDPSSGEQCEPPNSLICDATCKQAAPPGCGDGVRMGIEQCDDGNNLNTDGCDFACRFEQDHRSNSMKMQFGTDPYCNNANKIGTAINPIGQGTFQQAIDAAVNAGTAGILFKVMDLDDFAGQNDAAASLGMVGGPHAAGAGYNGANDVDWWYTVEAMWLDANRNPTQLLQASFTAGVMNASGNAVVPNFFTTSPPSLSLSNVKMQLNVGPSTNPLLSVGAPPGHLAAENLDPTITSFQTMGAGASGKLCANVAAASLAAGSIPADLQTGGATACAEGYGANATLLDLFVGGCTVFNIMVVTASQPDKVDPSKPPAGNGGPYTLSADAMKHVSTCTDGTGAVVNLMTCLDAAAYSAYFKFSTDRIILK